MDTPFRAKPLALARQRGPTQHRPPKAVKGPDLCQRSGGKPSEHGEPIWSL